MKTLACFDDTDDKGENSKNPFKCMRQQIRTDQVSFCKCNFHMTLHVSRLNFHASIGVLLSLSFSLPFSLFVYLSSFISLFLSLSLKNRKSWFDLKIQLTWNKSKIPRIQQMLGPRVKVREEDIYWSFASQNIDQSFPNRYCVFRRVIYIYIMLSRVKVRLSFTRTFNNTHRIM